MTLDRHDGLRAELRIAVEGGQYLEIARIADLYCAESERRLQTLAPGSPEAEAVIAGVLAALDSTLAAVLASREKCRIELQRAGCLSRFTLCHHSNAAPTGIHA